METGIGWSGRRIGDRYNVLFPISETRMSVIYQAQDVQNSCSVIVKVAKDGAGQSQLTQYLRNEVAALQVMNHQNVVRLVDSGEFRERYFAVLEFVDGLTISNSFNDSHPLSVDCAVFVMLGVLEALQHANQAGFVHCDIKPENVMSTSDGVIKLIDFGLSRPIFPVGQSLKLPLDSGCLAGTLLYLSPEQSGFKDLDCRSDIFSCGVLLYHMLTGKLPFPMRKFVNRKKDWLAPILPFPDIPVVPYGVQDVVRKALQANPNERFQSPADMSAALSDAMEPISMEEIVLGEWSKIVGEVTQPIKLG